MLGGWDKYVAMLALDSIPYTTKPMKMKKSCIGKPFLFCSDVKICNLEGQLFFKCTS